MKKILLILLLIVNAKAAYNDVGTDYSNFKSSEAQKIGISGKIVDNDFMHIKDYWSGLNQMHFSSFLNKGDYNGTIIGGNPMPFAANVSRANNSAPMVIKVWFIASDGTANGYVWINVKESPTVDYPLGVLDLESNIVFTGYNTKLSIEKGANAGEQILTYMAKENGYSTIIIRKVVLNSSNNTAYGSSSEQNGTVNFDFKYDANYINIDGTYFDRNHTDSSTINSVALFDATTGARHLIDIDQNATDASNCSFRFEYGDWIYNPNNCTLADDQLVSINGVDYRIKIHEKETTNTTVAASPTVTLTTTHIALPTYSDSSVKTDIGEAPTSFDHPNAVLNGKIVN